MLKSKNKLAPMAAIVLLLSLLGLSKTQAEEPKLIFQKHIKQSHTIEILKFTRLGWNITHLAMSQSHFVCNGNNVLSFERRYVLEKNNKTMICVYYSRRTATCVRAPYLDCYR